MQCGRGALLWLLTALMPINMLADQQTGETAAARESAGEEQAEESAAAELQQWKRRAYRMSAEWAAMRAERDALRQTLEQERRIAEREAGAAIRSGPAHVLDVNEELGWVVLGIGNNAGVKPGMMYRVVREGRVVAYLRMAEVRRHISGAEVWKHRGSVFPRVGDYAVPGGAPEDVEITPWK